MFSIIHRLPIVVELFINGTFILFHALFYTKRLPQSWDLYFVAQALQWSSWIVPIVLFFVIVMNYQVCKNLEDFIRKHIFSIVVFIPTIITIGDLKFTFWLAASHLLATILSIYEKPTVHKKRREKEIKFGVMTSTKNYILEKLKFRPAQLILVSFAGLILIGTGLLMLPFSSSKGETTNFIDALFMATSATCVTGLSTLSLGQHFSFFGQVVILALIQIGGLGYMTLASSVTILLGRSMGMKDRLVMQDLLNVGSQEELLSMIIDIIKFTVLIELWGGIILTIAFTFEGFELSQAIYYGFFHSISAFCNAGFSLFDNSLESFSTKPLIHLTISTLVILGGLGFIVLKELQHSITEKKSFVRFGLHTKITLISTFILITAGTLIVFFGEFLHSLDGYNLWEKMQISFFQSVTLRTAGFNTIPMTSLNSYTIYVMSLFMFIGAGSGSTAGGIKISTFAILVQSVKSTLKGRDTVEFFDRRIPSPIVVKATAVTIISLMITSFFIFILMKLEPEQNFLTIFFEAISASATVGLSLGLTPYLSVMGKLAISMLMFIGRTGPLTLVLAIGQRKQSQGAIDYPEGRVMIG